MTDLLSQAHDGRKGMTDKKSIMCLKTIASSVPVRLAIIIGDSGCSARGGTADLTVEFHSHRYSDGTMHALAPSIHDQIAANAKDV
jgi:hypothetical protein